MKKIVFALVLSLCLVSTPLQVGLTGTGNQSFTELSLQISQMYSLPQTERAELEQIVLNLLNQNRVGSDVIKDIIENGRYRSAEAVQFELQAHINGLDSALWQRIRVRLNARNNQQVTGLAAQCLQYGLGGEELALELQNRAGDSSEALQQALQNMLNIQLHTRLRAHSENEDCDCEECIRLRERLRDGSCCDCDGTQKQESNLNGKGPEEEVDQEKPQGDGSPKEAGSSGGKG